MNDATSHTAGDLHNRPRRELIDSFDEALELDDHVDPAAEPDWIAASRQRANIVFEGRDAAGRGGVIKRITQRLNPRVCRVGALPAPNGRERTQWAPPS